MNRSTQLWTACGESQGIIFNPGKTFLRWTATFIVMFSMVAAECAETTELKPGGDAGERLAAQRKQLVERGGLAAACTYANFVSLPQYKANLHCHSNHSDGVAPIEKVARWYENHGYRILAITDHDGSGDQDGGVCDSRHQKDAVVHDWDGDGVTHEKMEPRSGVEAYVRDYDSPEPPWAAQKWKLNRPGQFVVLNGMESTYGHDHANVIEPPIGKIPRPRESYGFIDWCHSNNGVVFLNHPATLKYSKLGRLQSVDGLEVMNGHSARYDQEGKNTDGSPGFAEPLWNDWLDAGRLIWGFANDDAHNLGTSYSGPGTCWNMVWAKELTKSSVMDSLRAGAFYATSGIEIDRVSLTPETLAVHSPNATHIQVVGNGGRILCQVDGSEVTYRIAGDEKWIRVTLWNDKMCYSNEVSQFPQKAWMQPIFLEKLLGNDAPSKTSSGRHK